jgi:NAD(P)-dependent dehydrogenase (short-subunit alcohol dehydrogenase family)
MTSVPRERAATREVQRVLVTGAGSGIGRATALELDRRGDTVVAADVRIDRIDSLWERGDIYDAELRRRVPDRPSSYVSGRIYGCVYDDVAGLKARDQIGMDQIMFEIDYPHADSTWPHSRQIAQKIVTSAGLTEQETRKLLRQNAIACYGLDRSGVAA